MPKKRSFKIYVDVHEIDSPLYKELIGALHEDEWTVKGGKKCEGDSNYDPCADYIVEDVHGISWGIERKSFLDCYNSVVSKRVYGQLAELHGKYPNRAIFLLESPSYFPSSLRNRRHQIIKAVYTFFNERSMSMPCWIVSNPKHGAELIIKLAKGKLKFDLNGRGFTIKVN